MKFAIIFTLIAVALALPVQEDETEMFREEARNMYLFGEPNPAWLKYINAKGEFDPSLVPEGEVIQPPQLDPFYDAPTAVKFFLHTRRNDGREQLILEDADSVRRSTFDPTKEVRVLVHGWRNDETSDFIQVVKDAYLAAGDYNVIAVDWSKGGDTWNYWSAKGKIGDVADVVFRFINHLVLNNLTGLRQFQMVGHSLGAHIIGLTSKNYRLTRIPVLIGLDPALPWFDVDDVASRIDADDADYVEIIHTNAGNLGIDVPIGHADFYPNWGSGQPGCFWSLTGGCDHGRSYEFFAESVVNQDAFISRQCDDWKPSITKKKCGAGNGVFSYMGGQPSAPKVSGVYYLTTTKNSPFGVGWDF